MKKIGIITYNMRHLKTEQIMLRLSGRYDMMVYALPFIPRAPRSVLFQHRPEQMSGAFPKELANYLGASFQTVANDAEIPNDCELYLITGAGILSEECLKGKKVLNCHPGIIPAARGLDAFKWSIYRQQLVGVTLHFVDAQVDAGEIISVIKTPVFLSDNLETFARRHYENEINMMANFDFHLSHPQNRFCSMEMQESTRRMPMRIERELEESFKHYQEKFSE